MVIQQVCNGDNGKYVSNDSTYIFCSKSDILPVI